MNRLFFSIIAALLLMSCEKPLLTDTGEGTQDAEGNLTVSVFRLDQTPFSELTRSAAVDACTRLNFAVYQDGARIKQVNQMLGDANFGTATFQLAEGTYQLVAVAHSSVKNPTMTNPAKIQFTNACGYSDTFLYNSEVTVTDAGQSEPLLLSLNRIVSMCRFIMTDDYPQGVAKMRFYYTGGSGAFDASTGLGTVNSKQSVFFDVTGGLKQFDLYTFLHDTDGTLHFLVTAYDANDNILNEREFDVPMTQNRVTILTGPLFSTSGTSATGPLTIDINTTWAGETTIYFD